MELFYAQEVEGNYVWLSEEETLHCVRVLRHRVGDEIFVADGAGVRMNCIIVSAGPGRLKAEIVSREAGWNSHPYRLELAVCPTKNLERYEWMAEKACEVGFDRLTPLFGEHSERRVFKPERVRRILLSAAKQSLKAAVPELSEPETVSDFLRRNASRDACKLIAWCFEEEDAPRVSLSRALEEADGKEIVILIGPEGDFSEAEARLALASGFRPVHLGSSRLRTETAALLAATAVYLHYLPDA